MVLIDILNEEHVEVEQKSTNIGGVSFFNIFRINIWQKETKICIIDVWKTEPVPNDGLLQFCFDLTLQFKSKKEK